MITNIFSNDVTEVYAKLIIKHNLSQKAADDIRRFFNEFSLWSKSPLPSSAKQIQQIIDQVKTKNTEFADVWSPMLDNRGVVLKHIFGSDSLHMNKEGYVIWESALRPFLKQ